MALKIDITNNKGVMASYHRIISITQVYDNENKGIHINLAGYVNKEYRDKEDDTIVMNTPIFLNFDASEDYSRKKIYDRIKNEIQELSTAENI